MNSACHLYANAAAGMDSVVQGRHTPSTIPTPSRDRYVDVNTKPDQNSAGCETYRLLREELIRAGCFRPAKLRSIAYGVVIIAVYCAGYAALLMDPTPAVRVLAIVALAFTCVHAGYLAHEAGHGALTRHRWLASLVGQIGHTLLAGLPYSYFRHIHRIHHPQCNGLDADPDMQSAFFSLYRQSAIEKTGFGKLITRYQSVLLWVLIGLQGFTLKIDGVSFLARNQRTTRTDQALVLLHVAAWLIPPVLLLGFVDAALNYALMSVLIGYYVGNIFIVNHIGTRVIEPEETISFFEREVTCTRNLGRSRISDFLCGGLNNHIEHHLFPNLPSARLRSARGITRAFCHERGVPYREMSWLDAAREVTRHCREMSTHVAP